MFEVGDLVKYNSGESVYKVESIKNGFYKIRNLGSGKIYSENVSNRLVKLKFKIGDKVRILSKGVYENTIATITGVSISSVNHKPYYDIKSCNIGFMEELLELVTEESSKFKVGDLVYVNSTKVLSSQCYTVLQVIGILNSTIKCSNPELKKYAFDEKCLIKFKFQPRDIVQVINEDNMYYGKVCIVNKISFSNKTIYYNLDTAIGCFREDELVAVSEYKFNDKISCAITTVNDDKSIQVVDGETRISKHIIDNLEERVSDIIDTYISNNNLNQNQNENQLQREETPLRGDDSERVGVHGGRHQVAIRECYKRYEAGFSKSKKHSVRLKEQLSTSYSRTYGSKD